MDEIEWSKNQEKIFSGGKFGVTEKEYKTRPDHYLRAIEKDTSIKKDSSILCLGCNDGSHVNCFYFEGYDAFGCDLPDVIKLARGRYTRIADRLICCNLDKEDLSTRMYAKWWDLIFAKSSIEHLEHWDELPEKMYNAQRVGGEIWVATKNGDVTPDIEPEHFVHITWDAFEHIFKDAGYTVLKHYIDPLSGDGQIIVCRKE